MFCGPETVDVSRGEAEGNIDSRDAKNFKSNSVQNIIHKTFVVFGCDGARDFFVIHR